MSLKRLTSWIITVLVVGFIWQKSSIQSPYQLIPPPKEVIIKTINLIQSKEFYFHLGITTKKILISTLLSLVIGTFTALIVNKSKILKMMFDPLITIGLILPSIVLSYIGIIALGTKESTQILVVTAIVTPLITTNLIGAIKQTNEKLIELAKIYQISKANTLFHIILPQFYPLIISNIKTSLSISWKVAILIESITINKGVGYAIYTQFQLFSLSGVLSWTLGFLLFAIIIYTALDKIEEKLIKYKNA